MSMKYRTLGNTGISVSEIGYGTWGIGGDAYGPVDDAEARRALALAFERGVTLYDTADLYGGGHSEELLAASFAAVRDRVVIATKGGMLPHTTFVMPQDFSSAHLRRALEGSLKRLKTDFVDLYLLHSPQLKDLREKDDLFSTLEVFRTEGKIRAFGISARSPQDALQILEEAFPVQVLEVNFNLIDHRALEIGLFDRIAADKIGLIIRTPLTFGFLTGKLGDDHPFEGKDHRSNWPREQIRRWSDAHRLFSFLFDGTGRTPAQSALRFCLDFGVVSSVIPGMLTHEQVEENVQASGMPSLAEGERKRIMNIYRNHEFYDRTFQKVKAVDPG